MQILNGLGKEAMQVNMKTAPELYTELINISLWCVILKVNCDYFKNFDNINSK